MLTEPAEQQGQQGSTRHAWGSRATQHYRPQLSDLPQSGVDNTAESGWASVRHRLRPPPTARGEERFPHLTPGAVTERWSAMAGTGRPEH